MLYGNAIASQLYYIPLSKTNRHIYTHLHKLILLHIHIRNIQYIPCGGLSKPGNLWKRCPFTRRIEIDTHIPTYIYIAQSIISCPFIYKQIFSARKHPHTAAPQQQGAINFYFIFFLGINFIYNI